MTRKVGRKEIGGRVNVRLGDLKAAVDAYANERDVSRSEAVRLLTAAGLRAKDHTAQEGGPGNDNA